MSAHGPRLAWFDGTNDHYSQDRCKCGLPWPHPGSEYESTIKALMSLSTKYAAMENAANYEPVDDDVQEAESNARTICYKGFVSELDLILSIGRATQ